MRMALPFKKTHCQQIRTWNINSGVLRYHLMANISLVEIGLETSGYTI